jgi:putative FmdB family regulatory protein
MLILFDWKCGNCGHEFEQLAPSSHKVTGCPECHMNATRVIAPVRCQLEGISGHFPDAADKWARQHERAGKEPVE